MGDPSGWYALANCRGLDPELFYPTTGEHESAVKAKAVCDGCEVRADCLDAALAHNELFGIWGGRTVRERRREIRTRLRSEAA